MSVVDSAPALLIKINGLPAHPLLVHATVVLVPLAALGAIAYLVPSWRDWLRWPLLVTAVLSFVFIWAAYLSGDNFKESVSYFNQGQLGEQIEKHEQYADVFRIVGTAFSIAVVVVTGWLHRKEGAVRTAASGVAAALAVVTLVYVFLTGEAGAKAVYPPDSFQDAGAQIVWDGISG
jgi:uncharacterized membrane protein